MAVKRKRKPFSQGMPASQSGTHSKTPLRHASESQRYKFLPMTYNLARPSRIVTICGVLCRLEVTRDHALVATLGVGFLGSTTQRTV